MSEIPQRPEREITPETLPEIRQEIASLREQKGKDKEALREIRWAREGAKDIEAHEDVIDLYWEEYLVGKHIAMDARDKKGLWQLPVKAKGILEGFLLMRESAHSAQEYIDEHYVENKRPRSGRFLGELARLTGRYDEAIRNYELSIGMFEHMSDWQDRVNALELKGFLAEVLIVSGEAEKGVGVSRKTFLEYDKGDGARLKEEDYYTWAVWKSGCVIKAWHGLLARDIPINEGLREGMVDMLLDAEDILVIPEDEETWGDRNFEIRKQEIVSIKKAIKDHGLNIK